MTFKVVAVAPEHKDGWLAMWAGYLTFYKEDLPAAQTELTWQRLLDSEFNLNGFVAVREGLNNYMWSSFASVKSGDVVNANIALAVGADVGCGQLNFENGWRDGHGAITLRLWIWRTALRQRSVVGDLVPTCCS